MKIRQEIRQNGKLVMHSTDGVSVPVIFNNLIGKNSPNNQEYQKYLQVMFADFNLEYGEIEMYERGILIRAGTISQTLNKDK